MTLGAEPKKIILLGLLVAGVGIALYVNVFSGDSSAPAAARPVAAAEPAPVLAPPPATKTHRSETRGGAVEFKPRMGSEDPQKRVDPAKIDPTLRLDLLAKIQNVKPEEALRNVFQYGMPPAVAPPAPKDVLPSNVPKIVVNQPKPGPAPAPPGPPPPAAAPVMTFKYYGYKVSKASGRKQAFLLDGDEIFIAGENDAVKSPRYRVLHIGVSSITIEDTQFKSSQTIQLQEETAG